MGEGNAKVQITVKVARSVSVIGQGNVGAAEDSREGNEGNVSAAEYRRVGIRLKCNR